jgi:Tim10/DDP family zinc finger
MSANDKKELQAAVLQAQAEINMQMQQNLTEKMISLCFDRCVPTPTPKLEDKQRRCLDMCSSAFLEGFGVATEAFSSIAKRQAASE